MIKRLVPEQTRKKMEAARERIHLKWLNRKKGSGFGPGLGVVLVLAGVGLTFVLLFDPGEDLGVVTLAMTTDRGLEPVVKAEDLTGSSQLPKDWQTRFAIQRKQVPDYERTGSVSKQYRQLERQEILNEVIRQAPNRQLQVEEDKPQPETIHIYDRDLDLAGRGYEIGRFQKESQLQLKLNSVHIPEPQLIEPVGARDKAEDRNEASGPREHSFVRHSRATGFYSGYPLEPFKKGKQMSPPLPPEPVQSIPETRLLLDVEQKTQLHLIPHKDRLDLLRGDPNINRHLYRKRFGTSIQPPETIRTGSSKK